MEKDFISLKETNLEKFEKEKQKYMKIAKENIKKRSEDKKQVTFRLSTSDIEKIKKMAEEEGIPYQTLI